MGQPVSPLKHELESISSPRSKKACIGNGVRSDHFEAAANDHDFEDPTVVNKHASHNPSLLNGHLSGRYDGSTIVGDSLEPDGQVSSGKFTNGSLDHGKALSRPCTEPLNDAPRYTQTPIAICGMALRLPAGLKTPQHLWEFLLAGGDARGRVPSSRYNVAAFHDSHGKHGTVITEYGYFLEDDIGVLDTSFFSMPRMEVERTDPQQRLMLEVTRESFEDAGETAWRGKRIGCYMGSLGEDWCEMFARETQSWGPYRYTGFGDFALSNRISYEFDLQGPSITTRTACSASLVALHEACVAISRNDCDSAVVGGANLIMTPGATMSMTEQNVLSKDGSCKTFSAEADGYARGEAIIAIYIKRLDKAMQDGNPIRAIIKGTATNHDGKTPGMTVPSAKAQEKVTRRAYEVAGITDMSKTGFVECHGTGTAVGDPIEASVVGQVFGESGVCIGSIKPNFGHTEGASGLLSVVKTVLALEHSIIPPNIKCLPLNPAIQFESAKLTVPTKITPWPEGRLRRASVNSFGVGGTNAHAVIDSGTGYHTSRSSDQYSNKSHLLLFSANSQTALSRVTANYQDYVERNPNTIQDLAYTLAHRREHLVFRTFAVVSRGNVITALPAVKSTQIPSIVMVFTGQGAQWPQMGRDLLDSNETFLASIRRLDSYLQEFGRGDMGWSIETELRRPGKKSRVLTAEFSQPICAALQIALVDTLAAIGVRPSAVVGHSSGEIAAAYASGALTSKEAIISAAIRGAVVKLQKRPGAMAALGVGWEEASTFLASNADVTIACDNSPNSVTIAGDADKMDAVIADFRKSRPGVTAQKLQVDKAYHSCHMVEVGERYHRLLEKEIDGKEPKAPFYSSVTGGLLESITLGPSYWQRNLESPVLFRAAISSVLQSPQGKASAFLEIGPHSALAGPLRQILTGASTRASYTPVMIRNKNCVESLLNAVGKLYTYRFPLEFSALITGGICLSDLPPYPWDHEESYWYETRLSKDYRMRRYPHHDLLGARIVESTDMEPSWRTLLHLNDAPWLRDHKVGQDIVFPFAAYVAMAGEAIRQVTGIDQTFRLRHVIVSTALVLPEGNPVEMITNLRQQRLTDTLNSKWWEFTIASHNGHSWTKHCTGEAMARSEDLGPPSESRTYPRKVEGRHWFDALRKSGLDLGPAFRNLNDISSATTESRANANVLNSTFAETKGYHLHPAVVDNALQLMGIAFANGKARKIRNQLPVSCENFSISRSSLDIIVTAKAKLEGGSVVGQAQGVADGHVVLSMSGLKLASIDKLQSAEEISTHAVARLTWGPDIDFTNPRDLVTSSNKLTQYQHDLDDLYHLCLIHSQRALAKVNIERPYLQRQQQWINDQVDSLGQTTFSDLDDTTISERIGGLVSSLLDTPAFPAAVALQKICNNVDSIFSGLGCSWQDVLPSQMITELHSLIFHWDYSAFIRRLAHCKPTLRVLEIGGWSNTASSNILESLTLPNGQPLCSRYTFASRDFTLMQDNQPPFPKLEYATLDISDDPFTQGFENVQYDLIIMSSTIHTTKRLYSSLCNVRKLLRQDGHLLLEEVNRSSRWMSYIFGTHPLWWHGPEVTKTSEPCVNAVTWAGDIMAAGFRIKEELVSKSVQPGQLSSVSILKPLTDQQVTKRFTLLGSTVSRYSDLILHELEANGYEVTLCTLQDCPPPGQDIIACLDADKPFLENIDSTSFELFQKFLNSLDRSGLFWVTQPSQIKCRDPQFAQILGAARTIRSELLIDFVTCEVDHIELSTALIRNVFAKFQKRNFGDQLKPESEYVICNGSVNVGRYYPFDLSDHLFTSRPEDRVVLDVKVPGRPSTLHWVRKPALTELQPDEVEVEIFAVGLNFRDVLIAMNVVQLPQGRVFGLEGAGIIRRTGAKVKALQVGDRVAVVEHRMFATSVITLEILCIQIPDRLTFEEASTMFFPYMTAMHSLFEVGGLEKGQSILIHSACGGVGIAAIQLAKMIGAEIYATVGSEEKTQYLMKEFQLERKRIFNSRDASFVEGVMHETQQKGVDLILNSLSGELLHATWKCVAPFGKMVEIGKRDLIGFGKLDMDVFLANRSYCCVDADAFRKKPAMISRYMNLTMNHYLEGRLSPIRPIEVFDGATPYNAFRYMQPGQHIGRICMRICESTGRSNLDANVSDRPLDSMLCETASYLLVGGLGGLGRTVSTWMVEHGARHLIYLSRNACEGADNNSFIRELESMGCQVQLIQGSVENLSDVSRAVSDATHPVKGILQMSMVLRDENFLKMTFAHWNAATGPKVQGTWNLHKVSISANLDLDFFVFFSSLSGIIGQPGQANYASANTFLDAFVQYRVGLGLPASAIDIGAVADAGYISQNRELMQKMSATGFIPLNEGEVLDALSVALQPRKPDLNDCRDPSGFVDPNNFVLGLGSTIPLSSPNNRAIWKNDPRMAIYHNTNPGDTDTSASSASLQSYIACAKADTTVLKSSEAVTFFAQEIGKRLFAYLLKPEQDLDTSLSLADLGMDSLVGIELRSWWKQTFGFDVSVLEMLGMGTLEALGQHAAEGLIRATLLDRGAANGEHGS